MTQNDPYLASYEGCDKEYMSAYKNLVAFKEPNLNLRDRKSLTINPYIFRLIFDMEVLNRKLTDEEKEAPSYLL